MAIGILGMRGAAGWVTAVQAVEANSEAVTAPVMAATASGSGLPAPGHLSHPLFRAERAVSANWPIYTLLASRTLHDLALENRARCGVALVDAVEKAGLWVGLESFAGEANSVHEFYSYHVFEAVVLSAPDRFADWVRFVSQPYTLKGLATFAHDAGLLPLFSLPGLVAEPRESFEGTLENIAGLFIAAIDALKSRPGYRPVVTADLYGLGGDFIRDAFRSAFTDPVLGGDAARAFARAAASPWPLLALHRLLHVIQSDDHAYKVRESAAFPCDDLCLSSPTAFVAGLALEDALVGAASAYEKPIPAALTFGRRLARREVAIRAVNRSEMEAVNRGRMGTAVRVDNVRATRMPGTPDEILLLAGQASDDDALHEFVHILQAEREGAEWVSRNLIAAEMEAHAVEIWRRRQQGDHRLFRKIAALSPYGFAMGLRLYVEQVYGRLADVPGLVS